MEETYFCSKCKEPCVLDEDGTTNCCGVKPIDFEGPEIDEYEN